MYLDKKRLNIIQSIINYLDETQAPQEFIELLQQQFFINSIDLLIPGHPVGKQRPRLSNGTVYTPQKTKDFEKLIGIFANPKFKEPLKGHLGLDIEIYAKGKVSDIDNIAKAILDGLQGIAFFNDNQILELNIKLNKIEKEENERTHVSIYKLLLESSKDIVKKQVKQIQRITIFDVVEEYHRLLPELPKVRAFNSLKEKLQSRIREDKERDLIQFWERYFLLVRECPFLMGEQTNWHANLDWLLGKRNMSKVLNGLYLPTNGKNKIHNNNKNVFEKLEKEGFNL